MRLRTREREQSAGKNQVALTSAYNFISVHINKIIRDDRRCKILRPKVGMAKKREEGNNRGRNDNGEGEGGERRDEGDEEEEEEEEKEEEEEGGGVNSGCGG